MAELKLIEAVERFASVTKDFSIDELSLEWRWRAYNENLRYAFFRTYEELRQLAAALLAQRTLGDKNISTAQRALGQYHAAYRRFQAVLLAADDTLLTTPPAKDEWHLKGILGHVIAAEREFFARIWFAVQQHRQGIDEPVEMPPEDIEEFVGSFAEFERTMNRLSLSGILAVYDSLHKRVMRELADIRGSELDADSLWWEGIPLSVEFRLHRLDSHLRQHTVQIEKTLAALIEHPSEAQRLLYLIYDALADVESVIIGDWLFGQREQQELAATIQQRTEEIQAMLNE